MKFYVLVIFKKSYLKSPHKNYLETGYLIEYLVNDWYSTTNILQLSTWQIV